VRGTSFEFSRALSSLQQAKTSSSSDLRTSVSSTESFLKHYPLTNAGSTIVYESLISFLANESSLDGSADVNDDASK